MLLVTPNNSLTTRGDAEAGVEIGSGGQARYLLITHLELSYPINVLLCNN